MGDQAFQHSAIPGRVSVVIPVRSDPVGVTITLRSLAERLPPGAAYEVLVANDGADQETSRAIAAFPIAHEIALSPNRGPAAARNAALRQARGEVVAFLDADVTVRSGWWEGLTEAIAVDDVVAGKVEIDQDQVQTFAELYDSFTAFDVARYVAHHHAASCNLTVRRSVLEAIGGFDTRFRSGEDTEFTSRAFEAGFSLSYAPAMAVMHPPRDARAQRKKWYRVIIGRLQLAQTFPDRFGQLRLNPRVAAALLAPPRSIGRSDDDLSYLPPATRRKLLAYKYYGNVYTLGAYVWVSIVGPQGRKHDLS